MAHFRRRGRRWYAEVFKNKVRRSASFDTKAEATEWAARVELDIKNTQQGKIPDKTFKDLLLRYRQDVTTKKGGREKEKIKIDRFIRAAPLANVNLKDINESHRGLARCAIKRSFSILGCKGVESIV